jgi:hypothetical protein
MTTWIITNSCWTFALQICIKTFYVTFKTNLSLNTICLWIQSVFEQSVAS